MSSLQQPSSSPPLSSSLIESIVVVVVVPFPHFTPGERRKTTARDNDAKTSLLPYNFSRCYAASRPFMRRLRPRRRQPRGASNERQTSDDGGRGATVKREAIFPCLSIRADRSLAFCCGEEGAYSNVHYRFSHSNRQEIMASSVAVVAKCRHSGRGPHETRTRLKRLCFPCSSTPFNPGL